jgi:hypothetical protein
MRRLLAAAALLAVALAGPALELGASDRAGSAATYSTTTTADNPWQYAYDHATYVAGDSVTTMAAPYVEYLFALSRRSVHIDAYPGTTLVQGLEWLKTQRAAPPMAPTAAVCLGGNDTEPLGPFMWYVEGAIETLTNPSPLSPPVKRIIWVNFYAKDRDRPGANLGINMQKNQVVDFVASLHPGVVTVLDWASLVCEHGDWVRPDGVHYTDRGNAERAIFIAQAVAAAVPN